MVEDLLTKSILKVVEPSRENWDETLKSKQLDGAYAVLIGAAAGLLQCKQLLEAPMDRRRKGYNTSDLHADLQTAASVRPFGWACSENFHDWSTGYFVNRAEHNICSAYDRILSAWIALKVGWDLAAEDADDIWLSSWPTTRLRVLKGILELPGTPSPALIQKGLLAFGGETALAGSRTAVKKLQKTTRQLRRHVGAGLTTFMRAVPLPGSDCVGLVWGRTNDFKHRVKAGTPLHANRELALRTEWAVSVKAYIFVGQTWAAMLDDVLGRRRKKGDPAPKAGVSRSDVRRK